MSGIAAVLTAGRSSEDILSEYLRWVLESERMLGSFFASDGVSSLLFTARYWSLQTPAPASRDLVPLLVSAEATQLRERLEREASRLRADERRWAKGKLVVLDTSALIHGPKLWEWDPVLTLELRDEPVQLVIPMLVLDELDDLKESTRQHTRYRARVTLKWVSDLLNGALSARVRAGGIERAGERIVRVRGDVHLDVLMDDVGHVRLSIADDEIVDRAVAIASVAGRDVTLVTNDVGQAHRAHVAGVTPVMVQDPVYDVDVQEQARAAKQAAKQSQRADDTAHRRQSR